MYSFGKLIPEVSIVLPVYRNKDILYQLYRQLYAVLENLRLRYEIIFVEDACPEGSLEVLNELANMDPSVAILIMKKNVGQQRAVLSGLKYARGNMVVVMDADLQDPPEAIPLLLTKLQEGYAAVFAGRRGRYESALRLLTSRIFKWLLHLLVKVPSDAGIFVALNWEMVEKLVAVDEPPFYCGHDWPYRYACNLGSCATAS